MRPILALIVAVLVIAGWLAAPAAAQARMHVVQAGENLYRIALKYGVGVDELMRANGLTDPRQLHVGQVLTIPGPTPRAPDVVPSGTYVVQIHDTLYSIARRSATTVRAIMEANGLTSEAIYVGQVLVIPGNGPAPVGPERREAPVPPPPTIDPRQLLGNELPAPQPLRVRRGPHSYETTLALVAADTPLRVVRYIPGWFGVLLPAGTLGWVREDDLAPSGRLPALPPEAVRDVRGPEVIAEAMRYLGTPYVWGGRTSGGVDCSGFVYVVLSVYLPGLPRMSSFDYFRMGQPVARGALQAGDLVFFTTYAPGPSHVGIYLGEGRFIHASSSQRRVTISGLSEPYYAARFVGARRLTRP